MSAPAWAQPLNECTARGHGCTGQRGPVGVVRRGILVRWLWVCPVCDGIPVTPGPYRVMLRGKR